MNLEAQYAVAATKFGMAVVKKPRKKEVPHFIGQILRKATIRGPHLVATHKVDQKKDNLADIALRTIRRSYSFTEDDIDNIIRMGRIPKIRDLRLFGETRMQMEKELEDPVKIGAKDMLYDPEKQDSTFITGVHIAENGKPEQAAKMDSEEESSEGDDDSEGEREFISHYPLPLDIQTAVKSLRHAITNPTSYWRVLEDSYIRPTAASLKRRVDVHVKSDFPPLESHRVSHQELNLSLEDMQPREDNQYPHSATASRKSAGNTNVTPNNQINLENDGYENMGLYGAGFDDSTFQNAIAKAAFAQGEKKQITSNPVKVKVTRRRTILSKKGYGDLMELKSIMDGVESRLTTIELDLSSALKYSKIQKKLPQSKKLLKEIKEGYSKLQEDLFVAAKAKYKKDLESGFANIEDATDSELQLSNYQ